MDKTFQFFSKINGSTFRDKDQVAIRCLSKGIGLELRREPTNKYDSNAIMVLADIEHIGYLPRDTALNMPKDISCYYAVTSEITGRNQKNVGCNIEIHKTELTKQKVV